VRRPHFRFVSRAAHSFGVNSKLLQSVMAAQYGLVTRAQAHECGLTDKMIRGRISRDDWIEVHPGVHRIAAVTPSLQQQHLAAVLAVGRGAAISHRSAAHAAGTRTMKADVVEVSVAERLRRPRLEGVVVHHIADLEPRWVVPVGGVPTTNPARTLVDLGMVTGRALVADVLEEWLADRRVRIAEVRGAIDAHMRRGRRGVGVLHQVLQTRALGDEAGDSPDEHLIASILSTYGAPPPVHHHLVRRGDRVVAEVDFAYPLAWLGLELMGFHPHTRSRAVYEADLARLNLLASLGWLILQYTPAQIRRRPWAIAREIDDVRRERTVSLTSQAQTT